jgi:hypothetical protein
MRARTAIAWTAHRVRPRTICWGLVSVFACIAVSACTSSGTGTGTGTVFSPSVSGSVTVSVSVSVSTSPSDGTSSTPTPTPTSTITPTPSPSVTPSPTPTVTYYSPYPTAAPVTGGGGTAGFQDAGLAVLGGGAILAGAGSIIYRRHTTRKR